MALLQFAVASLGDGYDTARHLFLFHALTDVTVCFVVAAAIYWLGHVPRPIRRSVQP